MVNTSSTSSEKGTQRRSKRLRKDSPDEFSVEELCPDDMGYDADVEALQPDMYEEPDSDIDATSTPKRRFYSIDEDLAARMKHLGSERSGTHSPLTPNLMRGRKRRSLHEDIVSGQQDADSGLEIIEVSAMVERSAKSPPKKRRKRSKPGSSSHRSEASATQEVQDNGRFRFSNDAPDNMDLT